MKEKYTKDEVLELLREFKEIESILAEGLGYFYSEEYGWAIGDHTAVTLAMEARRKLLEGNEYSN